MKTQDDIDNLIFKLNDGASKPGKYLDDVLMRLAADALTTLRQRVAELEEREATWMEKYHDQLSTVNRLTTERDEAREALAILDTISDMGWASIVDQAKTKWETRKQALTRHSEKKE